MTLEAYTIVGLTAIVAALVATVVFALLRFMSAARRAGTGADAGGGSNAMLTMALQDAVTRIRDQERSLQERVEASEQMNRHIVESMGSGLMLVAHDGALRLLNPAGRRLLGVDDADAIGTPLVEVLAHVPELAVVVSEALETGRPVVRRTIALGGEGAPPGVTHLGVTVSPVEDHAPADRAVICLFTDLSAAVALEEQVRLKEGLARLGELTAGLAHEFRNGLATIHGYARMLDPDALDANAGACVRGIRQEADALGRIVTNFLEFARPTALAPTVVDLEAVVRDAAGDVAGEIARRDGSLDISGEFAPVDGDEVLLRQAFSNLCRNAVEAASNAGLIPQVRIDSRVELPAGHVRVTVTDNGPGIATAHLSRIFQPFFTTKPEGTGLGLALVQKIVVTHNGRVVPSNPPAGGAAFTVTLPLRADMRLLPHGR